MLKNKLVVSIILITIFGFVGGVYLLPGHSSQNSETQMSENAKAMVGETSYDWGDIGINDGNVEKEFEIKNDGTDTLKLSNVITSCMCTTALLALGDETSPEFGMHSKSSYVMEVPSGETAKLKVVFDPAFHGPSGVGPINRQVTVETNDPHNHELNFMLTAVVRK